VRSDSFVSKTIKEGLAPCLVDERLKSLLLDRVLYFCVNDFAVDFTLEEEGTALKAEGGPLRDGNLVLIVADFKKNLLVVEGVARLLGEFPESDEII
jgi:hypothetical protein